MRVMVLVKATRDSEKGFMRTPQAMHTMEAMGKFNDELRTAGILIAGDGLKPTSAGKRVAFDGSSRTVIDGPFEPARDQVAGFWVWQVQGYGRSACLGEAVPQSDARTERDRNPPLLRTGRFAMKI